MMSVASSFSIATVLGKGKSAKVVISSALLVFTLFFYIFVVGSYFSVDISPLENRVNHHKSFLTYPFGKNIDELFVLGGTASWLGLSLLSRPKILIFAIYIGAASLAILQGSAAVDAVVISSFPVILLLLVYNHFVTSKILRFSGNLSLNYLAILFTVLAAVSLIISSAPLFSVSSNNVPVDDYAYDVFLLFGAFSAFLIFFLITGSSARLLLGRSLDKILRIEKEPPVSYSNKKSKNAILCLFLIMTLSVIIALIPHYSAVNVDNQKVSADSGDYVIMLGQLMSSKDSSEFIHQAFVGVMGGDRPFFLIFWSGLAKIVLASPSFISDHMSVILSPALVLSIFLLTRELTSNYKMSLFAAFITGVSFQTLVSIYAGFYANSFALVIGYLSFVFLIRFLKKSGKANFIAYLLLMVAFVLSHVYTWTILTLVTSVFLIVTYKLNSYDRKRIILLSLVVLLSISIDVSRTALTNGHGGISEDVALASTGGAGLPQLVLSWSNLNSTMQVYGGGQFANFIVLSLGLYWLLRANMREPMSIFIAIFLSIGILPLLLGNQLIQFRVFYEIPFQIPAGIALAYLCRKTNWLMVLPACIWLVAVSLRMVTNFYFVSPS